MLEEVPKESVSLWVRLALRSEFLGCFFAASSSASRLAFSALAFSFASSLARRSACFSTKVFLRKRLAARLLGRALLRKLHHLVNLLRSSLSNLA